MKKAGENDDFMKCRYGEAEHVRVIICKIVPTIAMLKLSGS